MSSILSLLLTVAIVAIGVAVTWVVYRQLGQQQAERRKQNKVSGTVFDIKIELIGAAASMFAFILLALFVFKAVDPEPGPNLVAVEYRIVPPRTNDPTMAALLRANAGRFTLVLSHENTVLRASGFDFIENQGVLSKRDMVSSSLLNEQFAVATEPSLSDGHLDPASILLQSTTSLNFVPTKTEGASWDVLLDIKSQAFGPALRQSRMRHMMILGPARTDAAETLALNGYVGYGEVQSQTIWARSATTQEIASLLDWWSREKAIERDSVQASEDADKAADFLTVAGEELGFAKVSVDTAAGVPARGNLRLDNTGPVIGPIVRRASGRDVLIVVVQLDSELAGDSSNHRQEHLGELFPFAAKRSVFVVSAHSPVKIDVSSVRTEYKRGALAELKPSLGTPLLKRNERALSLDLVEMRPGDVARLSWTFR